MITFLFKAKRGDMIFSGTQDRGTFYNGKRSAEHKLSILNSIKIILSTISLIWNFNLAKRGDMVFSGTQDRGNYYNGKRSAEYQERSIYF